MTAYEDGSEAFFFAPVPLWVFDLSRLRVLFAGWRAQGISDLAAWLERNPCLIRDCAAACRLVSANCRAEAQFEPGSSPLPQAADEILQQLWNGEASFVAKARLRGRQGQPVRVTAEGRIPPKYLADWSRVVVSAVEIAETAPAPGLILGDIHARGLFEQSPVSLWVEDYSELKIMFERLRQLGVSDLRRYMTEHPEFVDHAMTGIQVVDVNARTLALFHAADKTTLLGGLSTILGPDMRGPFIEELIELWHGNLSQQREVVNEALNGERLDLVLQLSVMPGYEHNWSCVLIGLTDITARKRAETSLEYMASHDILTNLYNRSFFEREIARLDAAGPFPVSAMVADLNGLKTVNDSWGHAAGDTLIARVGRMLLEAVPRESCAARIGGDEFAILMPSTDEASGAKARERIQTLIRAENSSGAVSPMSLSIGLATCRKSGELEGVIRVADRRMYEAKRNHYASVALDRRTTRKA